MSIQLFANRALKLVDVGPLGHCRARNAVVGGATSGGNKRRSAATMNSAALLSHVCEVCTASGAVTGAVVPVEELLLPGEGKVGATLSRIVLPHVSRIEQIRNVVLSTADFHSFVFDVPGGEICSRMIFQREWESARAESADLAAWCDEQGQLGASPRTVRPIAILRSALTCRYEGLHIPPTRTADETLRLLSLGCDSVVWEEGSAGLTPRVLENFLKAAAACGVPLRRISLMLRSNEEATANCVVRAMEGGIFSFWGSSMSDCRFLPEEQVATLDELLRTAVHIVDESGDLTEADVAALDALQDVCNKF
jgi:hypothetical protein